MVSRCTCPESSLVSGSRQRTETVAVVGEEPLSTLKFQPLSVGLEAARRADPVPANENDGATTVWPGPQLTGTSRRLLAGIAAVAVIGGVTTTSCVWLRVLDVVSVRQKPSSRI